MTSAAVLVASVASNCEINASAVAYLPASSLAKGAAAMSDGVISVIFAETPKFTPTDPLNCDSAWFKSPACSASAVAISVNGETVNIASPVTSTTARLSGAAKVSPDASST